MRILQVGVGIRGGHWAEIIRDYDDAECVGYVDVDRAALEDARCVGPGSAGCYQDLDRALGEVSADAALVATPSALHAEHTLKILDAGLAVMVEKPLALTVDEGLRVIERAQETGEPVVVAENYRYWPAERTVREVIREGRLGRLDSATLVDRRDMPSHTEGPWLAEIEYPQLQEIAVHHFDSLRSFFGLRPTSVTADAWNAPWSDYRSGSSTEALIDLEGVRVQYVGTLTSHRFSFSLWIEGEDGVLWTNRKWVFWRPAGSLFFRPVWKVDVPPGDDAPYPRGGTISLLNNLRDAVHHGEPAETDVRDNIWNVAMVEAGKLSDREGRTVPVSEVYPPEVRVDAPR